MSRRWAVRYRCRRGGCGLQLERQNSLGVALSVGFALAAMTGLGLALALAGKPAPSPSPGPSPKGDSVTLLQQALDNAGVRHFRATELLRIKHPDKAATVGFAGPYFPATATEIANLVKIALATDKLRDAYGGPLTVINGLRPRDYNNLVSESDGSQHTLGLALDLAADDMDRLRSIAHDAFERGDITGLGLYKYNIHVDLRTGKPHAWGSQLDNYA